MTRINCVPVQELSDKHLGAEYRELPRVFNLAYAAWQRGEDQTSYPTRYLLGSGHVKFFYPRLHWCYRRFHQLVKECQRRGRETNFTEVPDAFLKMPPQWCQDWRPRPEDLALNRKRIIERSQ